MAIWLLGFSYAVPLTMALYLKLAGREKWPITAIMTFATWIFFYLLFERTLNVPFPDGLLFGLYKGE
jgi:Na+/proline symporter